MASWIHIDEMRALLELHYDDVHYEKLKRKDGKAPLRKGEHTVLNKVAQAYRSKLCQRLALPKSVKDTLRRPKDEDSFEKLEQLRKAIAAEVQGEELVYVATKEEAEGQAIAIESCESTFVDEVGLGSKLPPGTRVLVDGADTAQQVAEHARGIGGFLRPRPYAAVQDLPSASARRLLQTPSGR